MANGNEAVHTLEARRRGARAMGAWLTCAIMLAVMAAFLLAVPGIASANTLSATSDPERRGSVTAGLDNIVMQSLSLKTNTGSTELSSIKVDEYGTSDASATISSVKLYKETNGVGGLQLRGALTDSLVTTGAFVGSDSTVLNLSPALSITDSLTTLYIVYDIATTAPTGTTVGSRLADETYLTVSGSTAVGALTNLQSRELTLVPAPHASVSSNDPSPFSTTTNLCQTCHSVHMAPDFGPEWGLTGEHASRRLLNQPYFEAPDVVNDPAKGSDVYNALCFSCHDGTGAGTDMGMDIKSKYDDATVDWPGHRTAHDSTHTVGMADEGYKAPPSGKQYNLGTKIPCMICHDVHTSSKNNYAMLADNLYDYATANGWSDPNANGRIDSGDETCLVCHKYANETTRVSIVMGYDLTLPAEHDDKTTCLSCHINPHALDKP